MTTRTAIILGAATTTLPTNTVMLTITMDGQQVFSGPVAANNVAPDDFDHELCRFTFPIERQGSVPMTFHVTDGNLTWHSIFTNYAGPQSETDTTDPVDQFGQSGGPNTVESDGRDNIQIDGVLQVSNLNARQLGFQEGVIGDWGWIISDGQTLTADVTISAPVIPA